MPRIRSLHDDKTIATGNRRAASKAARLVEKLLDRTDQLAEAGHDKEAGFVARAAQSVAVAGGVSYDKSRLAEDRPTVIHGDGRDLDDILRSLNEMVPGLVVDSTCEPITDEKLLPRLPPAA